MKITELVEQSRIKYAQRNLPTQIFEPLDLIKKAIDIYKENVTVACSFGRCSVIVLHLTLQINPNIKVIFNNTGVEYGETYDYRNLLKKEWNLNLIETKPIKSFWQCVKEYGLPKMRKEKGSWGKPMCCWFCKDLPHQLACKKHNISATLTGMRVAESRNRMFIIHQKGQFYFRKTRGKMWQYHPIAFWMKKDIDKYFKENNLPENKAYKKYNIERTGCQPCTAYLDWENTLSKTNPKMYTYIKKLKEKEQQKRTWLEQIDYDCEQKPIEE